MLLSILFPYVNSPLCFVNFWICHHCIFQFGFFWLANKKNENHQTVCWPAIILILHSFCSFLNLEPTTVVQQSTVVLTSLWFAKRQCYGSGFSHLLLTVLKHNGGFVKEVCEQNACGFAVSECTLWFSAGSAISWPLISHFLKFGSLAIGTVSVKCYMTIFIRI